MLDSQEIYAVFTACLYLPEEVPNGVPIVPPIRVEGILHDFGLHPDRVKAFEEKIKSWIKDIPVSFLKGAGGGYSFLNLCEDRKGNQWGQHQNMEQLFVLCSAIGKAGFNMKRDMWNILPGGMPYVWFEE